MHTLPLHFNKILGRTLDVHVHVCIFIHNVSPHKTVDSVEANRSRKSTSEEGGGARGRASESRTSGGSTGVGGGGNDQSENSLRS